jgi:hypothetical protein
MLTKVGSGWGGWIIDTSLIRKNSFVLSAGLAHDITFDLGMLELDDTIKIIGIDPTDASKNSVNNIPEQFKNRYIYIDKALYGANQQIRIGGEASSIINSHGGSIFDTVLLNDILNQYDISILKMDIEGSEYSCINSLNNLNVDQVCIEWHHWLGNMFTIQDTISCIKKIESFGYTEVIRESENPPKRYIKESIFINNSLL